MADRPSLQCEIGPDGIAREAPVIAYTEKIIEEEKLQLKRYIKENYSKIRGVERELENLTLELKLTAGPKKAALEHLRKKIELSTERIRVAKIKEDQARKVWEAAEKAVKGEEEVKQKLCDDLNQLVQESTTSQFSRLEELKRRLEAINPSRVSCDIPDLKSVEQIQSSTTVSNPAPLHTVESASQIPEDAGSHTNDSDSSAPKNHTQPSTVDSEGKGKKRTLNLGRGKDNTIVPKGRGSLGPGWTGAGFDVDGRT